MENFKKSQAQIAIHWTVEEYLAYLYLSIASADMDLTAMELHVIETKLAPLLSRHFPSIQIDIRFLLKNLHRTAVTSSEMERIHIIEELNKKYKLSKEMQADVLSDLHDLINVDDKIAFSEYAMMHYIRACFAE